MTHVARPWIVSALVIPIVGCGGATTSTPPGPQPLEVDAGTEPDGASDGAVTIDPDAAGEDASESGDAAGDVEEVSCPGWIEPDETASCSQNSMNNQCSADCRLGTRFWRSQCQDGTCTCSLGIDVKCSCAMPKGACQSCCPGMVR